ncbi:MULTISPECIES: adenylate/guanylate cyclase domain-containing protein [Rhizobium]|uniref:Adenylate/guanylate cyclase domain-containing protein n=1 Tax=Rhizobium tropici TaxID=398 RepID=A0A6P1C1S9_RHITR|nr:MULTISPECIES: adenylate/guanylate cyclase domain-containing protein [Rhizobium]AGB71353.1 adenylate cyclase protein [Rhizobium tropici CIAT 899]MBB4240286.1 class 3 adenylate cyclase [Rhizobium tropici]MBB5591556.1 class 3 adenylate cyclase [Rhizobium tropici]MBB6490360.1 class 3 adenylate cyclase [Rhizobium tropici]NEV11150.1 adenylate/guanylate cyclase domain-containing protein [Rhizobium tropici]
MSETSRKLTTIFCADVQDYTRLMGKDEEGTLSTLRRYRDAMKRLIEAHGGRVINTWGDGVFAEFPSVVEAVRAAIDTQNELAGYNAVINPDKQMLFRIGLNLGDVIADGDDLYGDGVNIAARLQSRAAPGGIVISNTVYDQVRNKVAVGFDFLGQLEVKNIDGGVPSYAVRIGSVQVVDTTSDYRSPRPERAPARAPEPVAQEPALQDWRRSYAAPLIVCIGLAILNGLTWHGEFWAKWPILAILWVTAFRYVRSNRQIDMAIASLVITGVGIVMINLFTWHGTPWAMWPLFGLAIAAALRWVSRPRSGV